MGQEAKKHLNEAETVERKPKVLVFDQDMEDLTRLSEAFEASGFAVHKCVSVERAIRYVERKRVDFALIDLGSPSLEGLRVFRHLVRYNPRVPSVVTTQSGDTAGCREAFTMGAMECLEKPVSGADLDGVIQKYLASPVQHRHRPKNSAEV
jgi:DNA-binding NtrC family response regulator